MQVTRKGQRRKPCKVVYEKNEDIIISGELPLFGWPSNCAPLPMANGQWAC
mgnify:CR=1 FL=1